MIALTDGCRRLSSLRYVLILLVHGIYHHSREFDGWLAEVRSYTGRSSRRRLRCALDGPFGRLQCCTPHCARGRTSQSTVLARCRHSPSQMTPDAPRDCKAWRGQSDPIACVSQAVCNFSLPPASISFLISRLNSRRRACLSAIICAVALWKEGLETFIRRAENSPNMAAIPQLCMKHGARVRTKTTWVLWGPRSSNDVVAWVRRFDYLATMTGR